MLRKFLSHVQELRPHVLVTYNGDFFDWPYVEARCGKFDLSLYKELGVRCNKQQGDSAEGEYSGRCLVHLDAFCWVKRDSYLPQGTQGLKVRYIYTYINNSPPPRHSVHSPLHGPADPADPSACRIVGSTTYTRRA